MNEPLQPEQIKGRLEEYWVRHEHGSDLTSLETAREAARFPIYGVLDRIRSAHNVGSIFRTADGVNLAELSLCAYTPTPPHRHLSKTALGAVDVVPWRHCDSAQDAIADLKARGVQVLAIELTPESQSLYEFDLQFPVALVMGNEAEGLDAATIALCDATVHLPMHGHKGSLNVSVAFGVAVYEVLRRLEHK